MTCSFVAPPALFSTEILTFQVAFTEPAVEGEAVIGVLGKARKEFVGQFSDSQTCLCARTKQASEQRLDVVRLTTA